MLFICDTDIAHIYSKFFGHLPPTAEEYVSSIHKYFPYIIDTKVLLNGHDVLQPVMKKNCTSLSKAFAFLCPEIATGVKGSGLVSKHTVKVEVQVDDMRFAFPIMLSLAFFNVTARNYIFYLFKHLFLVIVILVV